MIETELLTKRTLREEMMNDERLNILDKVKEMSYLPKTNYSIVEQVADYYEVGIEAIKSLVKRNREELESNGMKKYTKDEILRKVLDEPNVKQLKTKAIATIDGIEIEINNTGLILFSKRAILNIGMLLDVSPIAKEVRTMLLDNREQLENINEKLNKDEEIILDESDPNYYINKESNLRNQEKELYPQMVEAISKGDMGEYMRINCLMNKIKEDIITLSNEKYKAVEPMVNLLGVFLNTKGLYDVGTFSKILNIDMGRNKLFEWMRCEKLLMGNNQPYQTQMEHFRVIPVVNKYNNKTNYKTLIKPKGIQYIYNRLIKSGKVVTKPLEDIIKELTPLAEAV